MLRIFSYVALFALLNAGQTRALAAAADAIGSPAQGSSGNTLDVTAFGAVGDGIVDDTPAIQRAIDAAAKVAGRGTVYFPARTYLLNSYRPSRHPWMFYNLIIGSHVTLSGQRGAKLLQGPGGRHPLPDRATEVRNTMLAFGLDYTTIRFQNPAHNGGFYALRPTQAGAATVTLLNTQHASRFRSRRLRGDLRRNQRGCPADRNRPARRGGCMHGPSAPKQPPARSFATPVAAKVTALATTGVGVHNLIVQGTEPLAVTEAFGFTARGNRFIIDTSVGGGNVTGLNLNTLDGFQFTGNAITCTGPTFSIVELPQRNSQHGVFEGNTFEVRQMGMGEYAAHWRLRNNKLVLHPDAKTTVGLAIGGLDIDFSHNHVEGGNLTGGQGTWVRALNHGSGCFIVPLVPKNLHASHAIFAPAKMELSLSQLMRNRFTRSHRADGA